jgi:hypothetical protein
MCKSNSSNKPPKNGQAVMTKNVPNLPSKTGQPSGKKRGNNPPQN